MEISVTHTDPLSITSDALVIGMRKGEKLPKLVAKLDRSLGGTLWGEMKHDRFEGKEDEVFSMPVFGKLKARKIMLIGLGDTHDTSVRARAVGGTLLREAKRSRVKNLTVVFPNRWYKSTEYRDTLRAFTEGMLLGEYQFRKYKTKTSDEDGTVEFVTIVLDDGKILTQAHRAIEEGERNAYATIYSRNMVNEPATDMTPAHIVEHAKEVARQSYVTLTIYDKKDCKRMGMDAFLGVARGSSEPPYFIHLVYRPRGARKKIVLIGKGVTFDSGGLSLKSSKQMEEMKMDMAGASAVLGVFSVLRELRPRAEIHGVIAATENMPGGGAMKPGDIVRAMNGKSIEVMNTDAEGRLTLADALSFADRKIKPDVIIDLATLTGSCMVALGSHIAGVMGNNEKLIRDIQESGKRAGEPIWPLPLPREYGKYIKSSVADLRNDSVTRYAGAITAGLFLEEFVSPKTAWAHLDIAGPAWEDHALYSYIPAGGTGFGVRTLIEYLSAAAR